MTTTDLHDRINRRLQAGRRVPELPLHTFKDSGVTVRLRKLSPLTGQEIANAVAKELADSKPQPPTVEVDYGQGKRIILHDGDPTYQELLDKWQANVNRIANDRLFDLAAIDAVELTIGEAEREQINRKKRYLRLIAKVEWEDRPELEPDENDRLFYMTHIACGSAEDLKDFYRAVMERSQPTEAAIERHKESFPGDVQGP